MTWNCQNFKFCKGQFPILMIGSIWQWKCRVYKEACFTDQTITLFGDLTLAAIQTKLENQNLKTSLVLVFAKESVARFFEDWCLPACLGDPDGIPIADFFIGYRAYCEYYGLEGCLFTDVIHLLGHRVFTFDQDGITGPVTLRKWRPDVQPYILEVKNTPWTKPHPPMLKTSRKRKANNGTPVKRKCLQPKVENLQPQFNYQFPSITSYTNKYKGRESFERFVKESFTRVDSEDDNKQKVFCVTTEDFYNSLISYCWSQCLPNPVKFNCGKHLTSIGIKKGRIGSYNHQKECYTGLKWKNTSGTNRNYNLFLTKGDSKVRSLRKSNLCLTRHTEFIF